MFAGTVPRVVYGIATFPQPNSGHAEPESYPNYSGVFRRYDPSIVTISPCEAHHVSGALCRQSTCTVAVSVRVLVHTARETSREEARLCRYLFVPRDTSGLVDGPDVVLEDRAGGAGDLPGGT